MCVTRFSPLPARRCRGAGRRGVGAPEPAVRLTWLRSPRGLLTVRGDTAVHVRQSGGGDTPELYLPTLTQSQSDEETSVSEQIQHDLIPRDGFINQNQVH